MKLDGDQYIDAAPERASAAQALYQDGRYTEAVYLAGVAVECVLRAYAQTEAGSFDARHDLRQLFKAATLERFVGRSSGKQFLPRWARSGRGGRTIIGTPPRRGCAKR